MLDKRRTKRNWIDINKYRLLSDFDDSCLEKPNWNFNKNNKFLKNTGGFYNNKRNFPARFTSNLPSFLNKDLKISKINLKKYQFYRYVTKFSNKYLIFLKKYKKVRINSKRLPERKYIKQRRSQKRLSTISRKKYRKYSLLNFRYLRNLYLKAKKQIFSKDHNRARWKSRPGRFEVKSLRSIIKDIFMFLEDLKPTYKPRSPKTHWFNISAKLSFEHTKRSPKNPLHNKSDWLVGSRQTGYWEKNYLLHKRWAGKPQVLGRYKLFYASRLDFGRWINKNLLKSWFMFSKKTHVQSRLPKKKLKIWYRKKAKKNKVRLYVKTYKKQFRLSLTKNKLRRKRYNGFSMDKRYSNIHVGFNLRNIINKRRKTIFLKRKLTLNSYFKYGNLFLQKNIYFSDWAKYSLNDAYGINLLGIGKSLPSRFRHTQQNPWKYYKISWWNYRINKWLNPLLHNRKLFQFHLITLKTAQKKHPHRRKRYKVYAWLNSTLHNSWSPGLRVKKLFRLRQLLFGKIILPSLGYLKHKQFLQIKKNTSNIKPLGLQNSRPAIFLGKFERRLDILIYKLNFAPTIQWARNFVESGLVYVSHLADKSPINYTISLTKCQKFPLLKNLKKNISNFFDSQISDNFWRKKTSNISRKGFNMPLPRTLAAYRVKLKSIVHWSSQNIQTFFYKGLFNKIAPKYFMQNKNKTINYFWRNLNVTDMYSWKLERIKKDTVRWLE